jgi:hypothetical protein
MSLLTAERLRPTRPTVSSLAVLVRASAARAIPLVGNLAFAAVLARRGGAAALGLAGTAQLLVRVVGEARAGGWPTALVAESTLLTRAETLRLGRARLLAPLARPGLVLAAVAMAVGAAALATGVGGVDPAAVVLVASSVISIEAYRAVRVVSGAAVATGRPEIAAGADLGLGSAVAALLLLVTPWGVGSALDAAATAMALFGAAMVVAAVGLAGAVGLGRRALGASPTVEVRRTTARSRRLISVNAMLAPATTVVVPLAVAARSGSADAGAFVGAIRLGVAGPVVLSVLAPLFLRRLADEDRAKRHRALIEAQFVGLALFVPYAVICLAFPGVVMGLLGPELADRTTLLRLVVLGQAINVATGPTDQVLNVSGRPRIDTLTQVAALVVVAVLVVTLPASAEAAATALLIGLAVRNLAATWFVWRR